MPSNANNNYKNEAQNGFWTDKNRPTVIGDELGRHPSFLLISPKPGELILDAGSGAGYMSRMIAKSGARVIGMEINSDMIEASRKINKEEDIPILYILGDIAESDLGRNIFDTVSCVAVIFHLTRNDVKKFLESAYTALKPGGKLVLSYTSKKLMDRGENEDLGWVQYGPAMITDGNSILRTESFKNENSHTFTSNVWGHESSDIKSILKSIGFRNIISQEQVATPESLRRVNASGTTGIIAFEQIYCIK